MTVPETLSMPAAIALSWVAGARAINGAVGYEALAEAVDQAEPTGS